MEEDEVNRKVKPETRFDKPIRTIKFLKKDKEKKSNKRRQRSESQEEAAANAYDDTDELKWMRIEQRRIKQLVEEMMKVDEQIKISLAKRKASKDALAGGAQSPQDGKEKKMRSSMVEWKRQEEKKQTLEREKEMLRRQQDHNRRIKDEIRSRRKKLEHVVKKRDVFLKQKKQAMIDAHLTKQSAKVTIHDKNMERQKQLESQREMNRQERAKQLFLKNQAREERFLRIHEQQKQAQVRRAQILKDKADEKSRKLDAMMKQRDEKLYSKKGNHEKKREDIISRKAENVEKMICSQRKLIEEKIQAFKLRQQDMKRKDRERSRKKRLEMKTRRDAALKKRRELEREEEEYVDALKNLINSKTERAEQFLDNKATSFTEARQTRARRRREFQDLKDRVLSGDMNVMKKLTMDFTADADPMQELKNIVKSLDQTKIDRREVISDKFKRLTGSPSIKKMGNHTEQSRIALMTTFDHQGKAHIGAAFPVSESRLIPHSLNFVRD